MRPTTPFEGVDARNYRNASPEEYHLAKILQVAAFPEEFMVSDADSFDPAPLYLRQARTLAGYKSLSDAFMLAFAALPVPSNYNAGG